MKNTIQILLIIGCLLNTNETFAQYYNRDSLTNVWENTNLHDTIRLNALVDLVWSHSFEYYYFTDEDSIYTSASFLELEAGRNQDKYQSVYHILLGSEVTEKTKGSEDGRQQAEIFYQKSLELAKAANYKEGIFCATFFMAVMTNDPQKQPLRIKKALEIGKTLSNKRMKAEILGQVALRMFHAPDFKTDIDLAKKALAIFEEIGDIKYMALTVETLSRILIVDNQIVEALGYYKKIERLFPPDQIDRNLNVVNQGLRNIYYRLEDWDNARKYSEKVILFSQLGMGRGIGHDEFKDYHTNGKILLQLNDLDEAKLFADTALLLTEKQGAFFPQLTKGNAHILYGQIYQKQNNYNNAISSFQKALAYSEELQEDKNPFFNRQGKGLYHTTRLNLGLTYLEMQNYPKAIELCRSSQIRFEYKDSYNEKLSCKCLYEAYKATGQSSKALANLERKLEMEAIRQPIESAKGLQAMEFEKQQLADSLAQVEKDLRTEMTFQAEIQQKNQSRNMALGIGGVILLLAGGLWNRLRFTNKAKAEIEKQKDRAEQSEKYKEQFLANMSHEIRTPMHAISGMTKILKRNQHASDQEVYLNAIDQSSNNLLVILNDILDLSKIEAGKIRLESIAMSPTTVIENVMDVLKFKAEDKGLYLTSKIAEDIPPLILGDPNRLKSNLDQPRR